MSMGESWLVLSCPLCKSELRIKRGYAHLRGRCPECGGRIAAPKPKPQAPRRISDADEPQGLVPIEEEWPEPARLVDEDDGKEYGLAATPTSWPQAAPAKPPSMVDGYAVDQQGWRPEPAAPIEPPADPYQVAPSDSSPTPPVPAAPYSLTNAELNPIRVAPPPSFPLWQGIFTFPFRGASIKPWIYLAVGFTIIDFLAMVVHVCIKLIMEENKIGAILPLPLLACLFIALFVGSYAASCFMAAVQDTAAGNDSVRWSDDSIMDRFFKFYYLVWLTSCAALPMGLAWIIRHDIQQGAGGIVLVLLTLCLFPVLLLSSLSAHSFWIILERNLLGRLLRHPGAWVLLFFYPAGLGLLNAWLIYASVIGIEMSMAPVAGVVIGGSILMYGRMIGRAGWLMTKPVKRAPKADQKPRKGMVLPQQPSATEEEPDDSQVNGWG